MYAERVNGLKSSAIRDILKLTSKPGMISLAGGLPAPEMFPVEKLGESVHHVLSKYGSQALQYCVTEGIVPLREKITANPDLDADGMNIHRVIVTQGSQQALELISKLYLDKGSLVYTENPSYLGALQAFSLFQAEVRAIGSDRDGIRPDLLRDALKKRKPAFLYLMPSFQNPTGISFPLSRRREILEIVNEYDLRVIEDDPYGALIFEGEKAPTLFSLNGGRNIIYLSTFSKTIAPGLRVAYAVATEEIAGKLALAKQGTDLQTNTFGQYIVNEYLESGAYQEHINLIRNTYRERRDCMLAAMENHFPKTVSWNRPKGGMFLWATLPEGTDAKKLLLVCIERNVAFVPGQEFFPDGSGANTARFNFSNASLQNIELGIQRIGEALRA